MTNNNELTQEYINKSIENISKLDTEELYDFVDSINRFRDMGCSSEKIMFLLGVAECEKRNRG